jgi:putative methyltransferase (TIGR04325 family)
VGDYKSWEDAMADADSYAASHILEQCTQALLKVKTGAAEYERDSVLFDKIEYSWPLLAGLLRAALVNAGELHVLDYGGSLGSTYFQNRYFLKDIPVRWSIVEQEHFVMAGKKYFEDNRLRFYLSIEDALTDNKRTNICLLSSVLPYLENPMKFLTHLKSFHIRFILIDRTYFINNSTNRLTVQVTREAIYKARYPAWFFSENILYETLFPEYRLLADFDSYLNAAQYLRDGNAKERGMIFERQVND